MTVKTNTFSGGSNGTTITTANSGGTSGDAFDGVAATGGTATYATDAGVQGALAGSFVGSSTNGPASVWWTVPSSDYVRTSFYLRVDALPSAEVYFYNFLSGGSGGTRRFSLVMNTAGNLRLRDGANAATTNTLALTVGTLYRVEMRAFSNATTGYFFLDVYDATGTTPLSGGSLALTNINTGAGAIDTWRFGFKATSTTTTGAYRFKSVRADDSSTASYIGPPAANTAPTASAGVDKDGTVGSAVSLTGTDSDSDGTVTARQWSIVSVPAGSGTPTLSGATTQTVSFTPSATGVYTLQYQVTDNSGANSTASQAKVYVAGLVARPLSTVSNTGPWANTGGAASLEAALADEVSSTYAESQNTGTSVLKVRLSPMQVPTVFNLKVDHLLSAAGSGTATVKLYKGATTIKTWTLSSTTTSQQTSLSLTSGEITSVGTTVTDWRALDVEITWAV